MYRLTRALGMEKAGNVGLEQSREGNAHTVVWLVEASKTLSRIFQDMLRAMKYRLTFRESEILGLLAEGLKNGEIAERLCISLQTVRWHLRSLYAKLGTHDRFSAASRVSFQWEQESPSRNMRRQEDSEVA